MTVRAPFCPRCEERRVPDGALCGVCNPQPRTLTLTIEPMYDAGTAHMSEAEVALDTHPGLVGGPTPSKEGHRA